MHTHIEQSHAYRSLLRSDLFRYHSERMIGLIMKEAETVSWETSSSTMSHMTISHPCHGCLQNTNPHTLFVLYHILLYRGLKHHSLFRSRRKWKRLTFGLESALGIDLDEVRCCHFEH